MTKAKKKTKNRKAAILYESERPGLPGTLMLYKLGPRDADLADLLADQLPVVLLTVSIVERGRIHASIQVDVNADELIDLGLVMIKTGNELKKLGV